MEYATQLEGTRAHAETNDCAVRAVAAATCNNYEDVHARCQQHGRKHRKGTPTYIIEEVILSFAHQYRRVDCTNVTTIKSLEKLLAKHPGHSPVMVYVRRHVLTIIDGKALDWASKRQYKIESVYVIVPHGEEAVLPSLTDKPKKAYDATKRPRASSKCGQLWAFLDSAMEEGSNPDEAEYFGWDDAYYRFYRTLEVSESTAKAQHFRWRKAHGHVGAKYW